MKVKIMQRSVYHKYAEIEIKIPNDVEEIREYLMDNENLWSDKMDNKISKAPYNFGNGMDTYDWTDRNEESEWMYMGENGIGGHL
tara:strand:+ start:26 stop:280 length:255 start_codon:yes stop_codon:yes gene_type:complete